VTAATPRPALADGWIDVVRAPSHDDLGTPLIIDDVTLTELPGGALLCGYTFNRDSRERSHPRDGDRQTFQWSNPFQLRLARSDDDGATWREVAALDLNMGFPFVHEGRLYLIGNRLGRRDVVICVSDDEGVSWTEPVTLFEGAYWNTPAGVVVKDGILYRGMGTISDSPWGGGWNAVCVLAGDLTAPLDPASWRISEPLVYPGTPSELVHRVPGADVPVPGTLVPGHWLEANVVEIGGVLRLIAVTRQQNIVGLCAITDTGTDLRLDFDCLYPVPGGHAKMFIIRDPETGLFWSQADIAPDPLDLTGWNRAARGEGYEGEPELDRHILTAVYSVDALNWFQAGAVVIGERREHGFQYAAPLIRGDDMLYAVRTGVDDAANQHDANRVTLHRVRGFRGLAHELIPGGLR
jgi:hypothetical protein